jgi:hypothetical protein
MAGLALCTATLGATTLHATPTKHSVRVTDIYALTAAPVILAQMDEIDALSERISRLRNYSSTKISTAFGRQSMMCLKSSNPQRAGNLATSCAMLCGPMILN